MSEMKNNKTKKRLLDMCYISLFCAVIVVCSWVAIPLTVSVTLQTFAICACAGLLGAAKGTLSVVLYIALGAVGLPVFTGFKGGIGALAGNTGGYIIGFIFTALIVGLAVDLFGRKTSVLFIFMSLGIMVCYLFGSVWYWFLYTSGTGNIAFTYILMTCVVPFLIPDAVKIILAVIIVKRVGKLLYK